MKTKLAFVLLLVTILFSSCSKEKTYSIQNARNDDYYGSLIVYEYAEAGDCVKAFNATIKAGRKDTFTANDRAVKVKLYSRSFSSSSRWVQQVYYLEKGNTNISIHDDLIYGNDEP